MENNPIVVILGVLLLVASVAGIYVWQKGNMRTDMSSTANITRTLPPSSERPLLHLPFNQDLKAVDGQAPTRQKNTTLASGVEGNAVVLESGSELAYSSDATNFNKDFGTVQFWFKPTTWDTDGQRTHRFFDVRFRCDANGCANYMVFDVQNVEKRIIFAINDCNCRWPSQDKQTFASVAPALNQWHHIAITWDKEKGTKLYFNGKRAAESTQPFSLKEPLLDTDPLGGIRIAQNDTPAAPAALKLTPGALVDEFRIDSYPKSDAKIADDYERLRKDQSLTIEINAGKIIGELPKLYRAGIWIQRTWNQSIEYIASKFFAENQVGKIQIIVNAALSGSKDFEDYKKRIKNDVSEYIAELFKKSGQQLLITHYPGQMPEWLSSRAGDRRSFTGAASNIIETYSPPKCYEYRCTKIEEITCYTEKCKAITKKQLEKDGYVVGWAGIVDYTLKYYYDTVGIKDLAYFVAWEQNKDWIGTEEELYKSYEASLKAAKNINPKIAVGGVGAWGFDGKRVPCDLKHFNAEGLALCKSIKGWSMNGEECKDPKTSETKTCKSMNENFLQYAKARNLSLDFLNYHMFGLPSSFQKDAVNTMKQWMRESGFSEHTPLYPGDWTVWSNRYPADYIDTEYNPAYVINSLYYMDKAGIQWHSHDFDVRDLPLEQRAASQRQNTQFIGDWPLFTRDQVVKPVYNAFRALSMLAGKQEGQTPNRLEVSMGENSYVSAVAAQTKDKKTTRMLLSNFIPQDKILQQTLLQVNKSCMLSKDYSEEEYKSFLDSLQKAVKQSPPQGGMTLSYIQRLIADTISDPKMKADFLWCVAHDVLEMKQAIDRYAKEPRDVEISVSGLVNGSYRIKKYLIDADHSNSCRYNKKTEPQTTDTPCGINGQIDQRVTRAKAEAERKGREAAFSYLRNQGYTERDLALGKQIVQSCKRKMACIQEEVTKSYQKLDRCKTKGIYNPQKCASADMVISELKTAFDTYNKTYAQVFFYDSPDAIDKINNIKEVRLDVTEQKTISITNGAYRESIKLAPHSVLLIEIEKL
ncbi:MAG: LamG domain-containing protein [bacterium]|nr:LamG domain-containing protein [bacterium]